MIQIAKFKLLVVSSSCIFIQCNQFSLPKPTLQTQTLAPVQLFKAGCLEVNSASMETDGKTRIMRFSGHYFSPLEIVSSALKDQGFSQKSRSTFVLPPQEGYKFEIRLSKEPEARFDLTMSRYAPTRQNGQVNLSNYFQGCLLWDLGEGMLFLAFPYHSDAFMRLRPNRWPTTGKETKIIIHPWRVLIFGYPAPTVAAGDAPNSPWYMIMY